MAYELEHIARNEARVALGDNPVDESTRRIPMQPVAAQPSLYTSASTSTSPISAMSPRSSYGSTFAGKISSYKRARDSSTPSLKSSLRSPDTSPSVSPSSIGQLGRRNASFPALSRLEYKVHGRSFSWASQRYIPPRIPHSRSTSSSAQMANSIREDEISLEVSPTESAFSFFGYRLSPSASYSKISRPVPLDDLRE